MAFPQPSVRVRDLSAADHVRRLRVELADGAATTLHVATYERATTDVRVVRLRRRAPLEAWCAANGLQEALVGGFYVRPGGEPLGELRTRGMARAHVPFLAPWHEQRACVHIFRGVVAVGPRPQFGVAPRGDLLQAGPLLVAAGAATVTDGGLTLGELAAALVALGATDALNLDGGGSTSLVCGGVLRNDPRAAYDVPVPGGREISTVLVFWARA